MTVSRSSFHEMTAMNTITPMHCTKLRKKMLPFNAIWSPNWLVSATKREVTSPV